MLWYPTGTDAYGQTRQGTPTKQTIEMVCKIYSQNTITDPRYVDIDVVGLTEDHNITTKNEIEILNNQFNIPTGTYLVRYVIPSSRLFQILMQKK